jgi:hypothetical protein
MFQVGVSHQFLVEVTILEFLLKKIQQASHTMNLLRAWNPLIKV